MNTDNPDPDPRKTPGLEAGGSVPPDETPPGEASTASGSGPGVEPPRDWARGPLIAIVIITALCAAFFLVFALSLAL
ncbi:hypothetical protein J7I98_22350 [Streptomyces sp. ISL-98]|uniref:DUF6480 family protein n=1 Tax=Streptomyces sp. ISL-98 TaxID=2819192 RepID=UPI001BE9BEAF|nr:DUF6480 family protein [Streptomyces sp. ISL-98]MBT2508580.1 hypothetical protein [Streptomyces sp. ISL-98]